LGRAGAVPAADNSLSKVRRSGTSRELSQGEAGASQVTQTKETSNGHKERKGYVFAWGLLSTLLLG
jgi:hypothetical protein